MHSLKNISPSSLLKTSIPSSKLNASLELFLITIECEVLKQFREENLFCRKDFPAKKKIYLFRKDNVEENSALWNKKSG